MLEFIHKNIPNGRTQTLSIIGQFPNAEGFVGYLTTDQGVTVHILGVVAVDGQPAAQFTKYRKTANDRFRRYEARQAKRAKT